MIEGRGHQFVYFGVLSFRILLELGHFSVKEVVFQFRDRGILSSSTLSAIRIRQVVLKTVSWSSRFLNF